MPTKFSSSGADEYLRGLAARIPEPEIDYAEMARVQSRVTMLTNTMPQLASEPELLHQWASAYTTDDQMLTNAFNFYGTANLEIDAGILSAMSVEDQYERWSQMSEIQQQRLAAIDYVPPTPERDKQKKSAGLLGTTFQAVGLTQALPMDAVQTIGGGLLELGHKSDRLMRHVFRTADYVDSVDQENDNFFLDKLDFGIGFMIMNPTELARGWEATQIDRETFTRSSQREALEALDYSTRDFRFAQLLAAGYSPQELVAKLQDEGYEEFNTADYERFSSSMMDLYQWTADESNMAIVDKLANSHVSFGENFVRDYWGWTGANPNEGWGATVAGLSNFAYELTVDPLLFAGGAAKGARAVKWAASTADGLTDVRRARTLAKLSMGEDVADHTLDVIRRAKLDGAPNWLTRQVGRIQLNERGLARIGEGYRLQAQKVVDAFDDANPYTFGQLTRDTPGILPALNRMNKWHVDEVAKGGRGLSDIDGVFDFYESAEGMKAITTTRFGGIMPEYRTVPMITPSQARWMRTRESWTRAVDWARLDVNPDVAVDLERQIEQLMLGDIIDEKTIGQVNDLIQQARDGQSLAVRTGRRVIRTPARLAGMFQAKVPINRNFIPIDGDDAIEEFTKFVNFGIPQGLSRGHMDELVDAFVRGNPAVRDNLVQSVNRQLFVRSGLMDINKLDDHGEVFMEKFLNLTKHQYGVQNFDALGNAAEAGRAALWQSQTSWNRAIPSFEDLMQVTRKTNFLRRSRFNPTYGMVESAMNRVWKPAQLMTYSFVLRAGGEESLSFMLRQGPMAYLHSQVFDDWARGVRTGRRSVAYEAPEDLISLAAKGDQEALRLLQKPSTLEAVNEFRPDIVIAQEATIMRPVLWATNSVRNWRRADSSLAGIRMKALRNLADQGVDMTDEVLVNQFLRGEMDAVRRAILDKEILTNSALSRWSIRLDEKAQQLSHGLASGFHRIGQSRFGMTKQAWGRAILESSNNPVARRLAASHRQMLNDPYAQRSFAEMQGQTFSPFSFTQRGTPERLAVRSDPTSPSGYTFLRMDPAGSDFVLYGDETAADATERLFAYGSHLATAKQDPLFMEIVEEFHNIRTPELMREIEETFDLADAGRLLPEALHELGLQESYLGYLRLLDEGDNDLARRTLDRMLQESDYDPRIRRLVTKLGELGEDITPRTRYALSVKEPGDMIFMESMEDFDDLRRGMIERQVGRLHDPMHRPYAESMQRLNVLDGKPVTHGLEPNQTVIYSPMNHASNLGYMRDLWSVEGAETLKDLLSAKLASHGFSPAQTENILDAVKPVLDEDYGVDDLLTLARSQVGMEDYPFVSFTPFATTNPELARLVSESIDETLLAMGRKPENFIPGVRGTSRWQNQELATQSGIRWDGARWNENDLYQFEPHTMVDIKPLNEYESTEFIAYSKLEGGGDRVWVERGFEADALGPNWEDQFSVTDRFISDESSFERAARQFASDQVDETLAMLGARTDTIPSPMTEITNYLITEKGAPTADYIHRMGTANDLPAEIPGPRMITSEDNRWDKVVSDFFHGVADPSITAMIRAPMYRWNYAAAMDQVAPVREVYRSATMRADMARMAQRRGLDLDWFDDLVETHWRSVGSPELIDDPVNQFATALQNRNFDEARGLFDDIWNDGAIANRVDEITDARLANLSLDGVKQSDIERVRHEAEQEARRQLARVVGYQYNWSDDDLEFMLRWANQESTAYDEYLAAVNQRAVELTIPFIDDHRIRSQFQQYVGNLIPFWYAEEQFLRRSWRMLQQTPEAIRRGQIYMNGLRNTGVVKEDQYGNEVLVMPNWLPLTDPINSIWSTLFGQDPAFLSGNQMMAQTEYLLPGYTDEFGHFQYGPMFEIPMSAITSNFPELEPANARWRAGDDRSSMSRSVFEMVMPSFVMNAYRAANTSPDANFRLSNSLYHSMQISLANGDAPAEDAPAIEWQRWREDVTTRARTMMATDAMLKWVLPGGMTQVPEELAPGGEGFKFIQELNDLMAAGLQYPEAIEAVMIKYSGWEDEEGGVWNNPQLLAYAVYGTETVSPGAPVIQRTEETYNWLVANDELLNEYEGALAWVLPYEEGNDEFDRKAHDLLMASELRRRRDLEEVETELYLAVSRPEYYRTREAYDRQIFDLQRQLDVADLTSTQEGELRYQITLLKEEKKNWSEEYLNRHPILRSESGGNEGLLAKEEMVRTLNRMASDIRLGDNESVQIMLPLLNRFQRYEADWEIAERENSQREAAALRDEHRWSMEQWATTYVAENPQALRVWEGLLRPLMMANAGADAEFEFEERRGVFTTQVGN